MTHLYETNTVNSCIFSLV